jgi:hypothetical protein
MIIIACKTVRFMTCPFQVLSVNMDNLIAKENKSSILTTDAQFSCVLITIAKRVWG